MTDVEAPPPKKEAPVLTDESLAVLAEAIGNCLKLAMYLNVPTTKVVNHKIEGDEKGYSEVALGTELLKYWKNSVRCTAKEKEKVAELERAIRDTKSADMAEAFIERYRDMRELTPDCFQ